MHDDIANHSHSKDSFELHFVLDGKGTLIVDKTEYSLSKGTFYVTGAGIYHEQKTDTKSPLEEWCVYIQSTSKKAENTMADIFFTLPFYIGKPNFDKNIFLEMYKEYTDMHFGYETVISGLMNVLLCKTVRLYNPRYHMIKSDGVDLNNKRLYLIECAFLYRAKELTLSSLSEEIGVCERQTQRILRQYYGMTFREKRKKALGG